MPQHILDQIHDNIQAVGEGELGLEHIELAQVPWCITLLGTEGWRKRPNVAKALG
jgi:hypothetical protein